jgi:hypothetical protein
MRRTRFLIHWKNLYSLTDMPPKTKKTKKKKTKKKIRRTAIPRREKDQAAGVDGLLNSARELESRQKELEDELNQVRQAQVIAPAADEVNAKFSLLQKTAAIMQKSGIDDYMALVNRPLKMIWISFLQGIFRGVGFFFGTFLVGFIMFYLLLKFFGWIYDDVDAIPLIGGQLQEFIGWVMRIIEQKQQMLPPASPSQP